MSRDTMTNLSLLIVFCSSGLMLVLTYQYLHISSLLQAESVNPVLLPDECGARQVYHHTHYHQGGQEGDYETHLNIKYKKNKSMNEVYLN